MRSILVHADRDPSMAARLTTALALARARGGHVSVLVDTPIARYISMDPMGGSYVAAEAMHQALTADDGQAEAIEAQLSGEGVPYEMIRGEDEPVEALAVAGRLADIVIVSRGSGLAGELALAGRTPVLVLPENQALAIPVGRACIAWDGGNEAALALRAAVPLLADCPAVDILTVQEKPGGFAAAEAQRYLAQHGIGAEARELARDGSTEATLARAVKRSGGDLLVMGAFGRSRMREFLFGGVTRHFLEASAGPALLLAH